MKSQIKTLSIVAFVAVMFAGCVSEQERQARAAAEKARQEQLAKERKEREERLARERKEREERIAKEKKEKAQQAIEDYWTNLAAHNAAVVLNKDYNFSAGKWERQSKLSDFRADLRKWLSPRNGISNDDAAKGEALLEGFGTKYMPNAYTSYEKSREAAQEVQQLFNEIYPSAEPESDAASQAFDNMVRGFSKARTRYFRCRDELCHFFLMHKVGALSPDDLARIDSSKIHIRLLEEMRGSKIRIVALEAANSLEGKAAAFAEKHAPNCTLSLRNLTDDLSMMRKTLDEIEQEMRILDFVRFDLAYIAYQEKMALIIIDVNEIVAKLTDWHMKYLAMDITGEQIAEEDKTFARWHSKSKDHIREYIKKRANGPLIPDNWHIQDWHWDALGIRENIEEDNNKIDVPTFEYLFPRKWINEIGEFQSSHTDYGYSRDEDIQERLRIWRELYRNNIRNRGRGGYIRYDDNLALTYIPKIAYFIGSISMSRKEFSQEIEPAKCEISTENCPFIVRLNEIDFDKGIYRIITPATELGWTSIAVTFTEKQ